MAVPGQCNGIAGIEFNSRLDVTISHGNVGRPVA